MTESANNEDLVMVQTYEIEAGNFTLAGEAASNIKKLLRQLGIDAKIVRKVSIAAYEAELNMVIHSLGGIMRLEITPKEIVLKARDDGPGIEDIELAMQEGYSTATELARELGFGAGIGLPKIKRCSDKLQLHSKLGQGTYLEARFFL